MLQAFFCSLFSSPFPPSRRHLGAKLGAKLAPSWAKLGASWAKLGPRCAMLAPSWPKLVPKLPKLAPKWTQHGLPEAFSKDVQICIDFSTDFVSIFHGFLIPRNFNFNDFVLVF